MRVEKINKVTEGINACNQILENYNQMLADYNTLLIKPPKTPHQVLQEKIAEMSESVNDLVNEMKLEHPPGIKLNLENLE